MTTIHFVRHGEVHNPTDVMYGRLPRFRLSERGVEQAKSAARYLKDHPIVAVFSSPMLRARQTAGIIAAEHGLKVQRTGLLNEIYTPYQGKPHSVLEAIEWRMYENIAPEYEQPQDVITRLEKFMQKVRAQYPTQAVVAVTHGDLVLHARLWALGLPITHEARRSIQPYPGTASLNTVIFEPNNPKPTFRYTLPY